MDDYYMVWNAYLAQTNLDSDSATQPYHPLPDPPNPWKPTIIDDPSPTIFNSEMFWTSREAAIASPGIFTTPDPATFIVDDSVPSWSRMTSDILPSGSNFDFDFCFTSPFKAVSAPLSSSPSTPAPYAYASPSINEPLFLEPSTSGIIPSSQFSPFANISHKRKAEDMDDDALRAYYQPSSSRDSTPGLDHSPLPSPSESEFQHPPKRSKITLNTREGCVTSIRKLTANGKKTRCPLCPNNQTEFGRTQFERHLQTAFVHGGGVFGKIYEGVEMSEGDILSAVMIAILTRFKVEGGLMIFLTPEEQVSLQTCVAFLDDHWNENGSFSGLSQEMLKLNEHPIMKGLQRPLTKIAEKMACSRCGLFIPRSFARQRHLEKQKCRLAPSS